MTKPTRRRFLETAAFATAALTTSPALRMAAEDAMPPLKYPIVDTHQHLWDRSRLDLPWLQNAGAPLSEDHTLEDYRTAADGLPIAQAIYMEVDADEQQKQREADYVLDLIDTGTGPTAAAILFADPALPHAREFIDRYRDDSRGKGFRRVLHGDTPAGYCLQTKFLENCRYLGEIGKTFDLCIRPGELEDGAKLASYCPQTTFILDHCGNAAPKWKPQSEEMMAWRTGIEKLAAQPNVICKISGIVARAPQCWQPEDLRPIVEQCAAAFGDNRLVFGSDWPVCKLGASLKEWVLALGELVAAWPEDRQEKLWNRNAKWIYRL